MSRVIWKLVFATAVVAVLTTWSVRTLRDRWTTLERARDQMDSMALLLEQHADRAFETGDKTVDALAALASETDLSDAAALAQLHQRMRALTAGSPQIASAWIANAAGATVVHTWAHPPVKAISVVQREYFQAHVGGHHGLFIGPQNVGPTLQQPRFTLSRSILRPDGSFAGVAVVSVRSSYFEQVYRLAHLQDDSRLRLTTAAGSSLAEWPTRSDGTLGRSPSPEDLTAEQTLARYPVRVEVSVSQEAVFAPWRHRTVISCAFALVVIIAFGVLTRMGVASARREEKALADLRGSYRVLEARVQERTAALMRSEMLLHRVLEHLPVGVGVIDALGEFKLRNPILDRLGLTGIPSRDESASPRWVGFDAQGGRLDRDQYPGTRALRGETVVPGKEFLYRGDDGSEVWRRVSAVPLDRGDDGADATAVVVVEDIDQLKRSEEEVSARLEELRAVYDTAPVGLCVLDRDMRYVRINRRMAEMNGVPAEDHIGRTVAEVLPEAVEPLATLFRQVVEKREPVLGHELSAETPVQPGVVRSRVESWVPLFDKDGEIVGINVFTEDTTERKRAERELRDAHLRLTSVLEAAGAGTFACELPRGAIDADAGAAKLFGVPADIARNARVEQVNARIHPDDLPLVRARVRRVLRGGRSYQDEYRVVLPGGSIRWLAARGTVDEERVLHGAVFDVTALKEAQEAALEREQQLRLVADAVPAMIAYVGPDERFRFVNRAYCEWIGHEPAELIGHALPEIAEPTTYAAMAPRIEAALRGERMYYEGPPPNPKRSGSAIEAHYLPYVDTEGVQDGFFLFILNVTEQKRRETELRETTDRLRLLVDELNHRVKNTLATVQSIVRQTLRRPDVPDDAREAIEARLLALGRSHDLLSKETWGPVELGSLAHEALVAFGVDDSRAARFLLAGPQVRVPPNVALALGMAFHELATNAVKHGALSSPEGTVELRWRLLPDHRLVVTWAELRGPSVRPPARRGFGTRLLEQGLAHALGGAVELDYVPEGLRCHIELDLPADALRDA